MWEACKLKPESLPASLMMLDRDGMAHKLHSDVGNRVFGVAAVQASVWAADVSATPDTGAVVDVDLETVESAQAMDLHRYLQQVLRARCH